jgi:hypothetical protein
MPPCCVSLKRLGRQRQRRSGEEIAQEVKAPRDATDEGFVGCLRQFKFIKSLVQRAHRTAQLAVAAREHQDVVEVSQQVPHQKADLRERPDPPHSCRSSGCSEGPHWVESASSTLRAADIRPRVGGATSGLPRWMTAVPSIPVVEAVVLLGEPMTASCQAP